MTPDLKSLLRPPEYRRAAPSKAKSKVRVDRTGGKYGAGVIYGASLITTGEALGWGEWCDGTFVEQVASYKTRTGAVKVRFTHPSMSSDGLGRKLGVVLDRRIDGEQSLGDVHFTKAAHKTPEGDLANYVMDLADESPEEFGMSIVYKSDVGAESKFRAENENEDGRFESPDPRNENNYPHVRLARLYAVDFVDDPAANPGGLYHRGDEIATEADRLCAYALRLSEEKPTVKLLGVDPDRLAAFAQRFLTNHGLEVRSKPPMADKNDSATKPDAQYVTVEQFNEGLGEIKESIAALGTTSSDDKPEPPGQNGDKLLSEDRKRVNDLRALAASAGVSNAEERVTEWINKGLSVTEVKAALHDIAIASNGLSKDAGQTDDDPHSKFRAEYKAGRSEYERHGVSEGDYVRSRCIDEGLPEPESKGDK